MLPSLYRLTKLHHILKCCRFTSSCGRYNKLNVLAHPKTTFEFICPTHIRTFCLCHCNFSWSRSMNYSLLTSCQFKRAASFCFFFGLIFLLLFCCFFFQCVRHNEAMHQRMENYKILLPVDIYAISAHFGNQIRGFYWILDFNIEHIDALKYFIY